MGANFDEPQIRIIFYKEDGTEDGNLRIATSDGSQLVNPTPKALQDHSGGENDFWKVQKYDSDNDVIIINYVHFITS